MARFIEGADRRQVALLPESLDDYVDADNPVRVVDAYVDALISRHWRASQEGPTPSERR
jgi:hypothetical protein